MIHQQTNPIYPPTRMRYLRLDSGFANFDKLGKGMSRIFIEINAAGEVVREVGINSKGIIIHKFPNQKNKLGKYGIFDLVKIDTKNDDKDEITKSEFENQWEQSFIS